MHIFHYLVGLVFISRVCAGVVPFDIANNAIVTVPGDNPPPENREMSVTEVPSSDTSVAVRSANNALIQGTVSWSFSGAKLLQAAVYIVNSFVVASVCVASGTINCAIAAGYAVFTSFFSRWAIGSRSYEINANDLGADSELHLFLPPTPAKSHVQRLSTELEPGTWHTIGHMRVGMFNHSLHYHNDGAGIQTLRAWQRNFVVDGESKRSESDNDGTVVDYAWQSTNEQAYDDFHSSSDSTSYFAANAMAYMVDTGSSVAMCADFADGDGRMDEGVLSIGWNDQPFEWSDGEQSAVLDICDGI
ncbi:hypothetical protein EW026_g4791 [Hermanssonia centrifuga]|uniref:Uncharacterized protein n=1 Tax=Hermanssonia centrifuga TaxID=98765 RepID=A0A4S4KHV0_9APHY|nr:hypothetical protein EW026_g4791 [Hermanssonia centrifuga]